MITGTVRRLSITVSIILTLALSFTLLTAVESKADVGQIPYVGATILSDYGGTTSSYFILPNKTWCSNSPYPWVRQVNETTGAEAWANPFYDPNYKFSRTDIASTTTVRVVAPISYPGGTVRAYVYEGCSSEHPDPATQQPVMVSNPITYTWDRTYSLNDAVFNSYSSYNSTAIAFSNDPKARVTAYVIRDYGTPQQKVMSTKYSYGSCDTVIFPSACQTSVDRNFYTGDVGNWVDTFGFAIIPDYLKDYNGTEWPPPGALDSKVAKKSDMGGPIDIPSMSQNGPSPSTQNQRMTTGDPIDNYTGNFFTNHTDLSITGRLGISADRAYSSASAGKLGPLGYGWNFGYDMSLTVDSSTMGVSVTEETGNVIPFTYQSSSGSYSGATPVIHADLSRTAQGWDFHRHSENNTYHFSSDGKLVSITDNNGNAVSLTRDSTTGRVTKVSEGDRWISFDWSSGLIQSVSDHTGRTMSYSYDSHSDLVEIIDVNGNHSFYEYDSAHRMTSMTNAIGATTTNIYDPQGRVIEQQSPTGQIIKIKYGSPAETVTTTETIGDVIRNYTYLKGRLTNFYDSADSTKNFSKAYDKNGNPYYSNSVSYPDGPDTYTSFDTRGNATRVFHKTSEAVETMTWNDRNQLVTHTDRLGVKTTNSYDDRGNLISTSSTSSDGSKTRNTSYAVASNGDITQITNPLGGVTDLESTSNGELSSITDPNGNKTKITYDSLGRKASTISPGGTTADTNDASKFTKSFTYAPDDNVIAVESHLGKTTYEYNGIGKLFSVIDPRGHSTTMLFDADGNLAKKINADGSYDEFTYDPYTGEKASWTNSEYQRTTYLHRNQDRTTTAPDGSTSKVTNYRNDYRESTYLTDSLNSEVLVSERILNGKTSLVKTYAGGSTSTTTFASDKGLKTREQTPTGTTDYSYDGFGNLSSSSSSTAGRNIGYQYDIAGNITRITYPDGTSVSRTLDKGGRVTSLTDWSGATYTLSYTSDGRLGTVKASNGLSYQQAYEGSLPTDKTWKDAAGTVIAAFQNAYDSSGQLTATSNEVNGGAESSPLQWDYSDRVIQTGTNDVSWLGKRVMSTDRLSALTYDYTTGRLTESIDLDGNSTTFSFDSTGRRTSSTANGTTTNYSWNVLGQLTAAGTDTYAYDTSGLRSKVNGTQQVYGQDMKLLSDGANKFLWGADGTLLAQAPLGAGIGSTPIQAVTDGMGSVYEMVQAQPVSGSPDNLNFVVQAQYAYSLFGERTLVSGTDMTSIGFVSEQRDATTGFIYLRARYYDPKTAQFISVDPMVSKTLDSYGYAGGNPLQMIDPLGLDFFGDVGLGLKSIGDWYADDNTQQAISTVLAVATIAATVTGVGAPVGLALGALSAAHSLYQAQDAAKSGDIVGTIEGITGVVPGLKFVGVTWRLAKPAERAMTKNWNDFITLGKEAHFDPLSEMQRAKQCA